MAAVRYYAAVFLVAAATLMLQVVETRILSVVEWYHLAFFVIGMAMFGLTAGAVWVYRAGPARFLPENLGRDLAFHGGAFGLSVAVSLLLQSFTVSASDIGFAGILVWGWLSLVLATPFFFSGVTLSLALTRAPFPVGRVYAADLAGAASGCLAAVGLIGVTDGYSAVLWIGALAVLGGFLFSPSRRLILLGGILGGMALGNGLLPLDLALRPLMVKGRVETGENMPESAQWNAFSRIGIFGETKAEPLMWGPSVHYRPEDWILPQRKLTIDGDAETPLYGIAGDMDRVGFLRQDVTSFAYHMPNLEKGVVIGAGGGRDLLTARLFGLQEVTGIEVNPILVRQVVDRYRDFLGLADQDGIRFVVDEARNWLSRDRDHYDIIQMSLVDTWAATGAGAYALTENGLYTIEAWRLFLRRLTPKGVFTASRWRHPADNGQTARLVGLAVAALRAEGVERPADHILFVHNGMAELGHNVATLVVARQPFSANALADLKKAAARQGYEILAEPGREAPSPLLREILASRSDADLEAISSREMLDLTPSTDDRPFFFNVVPFRSAVIYVLGFFFVGKGLSGTVLASINLFFLFAISFGLVTLAIVLPLRGAVADAGRPLVAWGSLYFLLIGLGFMLAEIALMQRFAIFLGHPTYSLSITLCALILFTGVGSYLSERLPLRGSLALAAWALSVAAYLGALPLWLPGLLAWAEPWSLPARAGLVMATILPAGLMAGYAFPTGMRLVMRIDPRPTPWFWGLNGGAGVLATSIAMGTGIAFGINATFLLGALAYALLAVPALALARARPAGGG